MISTACDMLMALTGTPRMFNRCTTRGGYSLPLVAQYSVGGDPAGLPGGQPLTDPFLDPCVGSSQAFFQRNLGLPAEHFPEEGVVGIAAPHSLGSGNVSLRDPNSSDLGDHVGQLVDGPQPVVA